MRDGEREERAAVGGGGEVEEKVDEVDEGSGCCFFRCAAAGDRMTRTLGRLEGEAAFATAAVVGDVSDNLCGEAMGSSVCIKTSSA